MSDSQSPVPKAEELSHPCGGGQSQRAMAPKEPCALDTFTRIFDVLDHWRHLPDYQLERRADVFFAAYLPAFLSARSRVGFRPSLIPEFPLRIGTIYPTTGSNQSCKVDYLALASDLSRAVFIELKTDSSSRRQKQDRYLEAAKGVGLRSLLEGLLQIVCATQHKHKYCCLLRLLEAHCLLELPPDLDAALASQRFAGEVNACLPRVKIIAPEVPLQVMYVQPTASRPDEIGFAEFAEWLQLQNEPLGSRFAASLRDWAGVRPGRLTKRF
jgi:hypothetical protein